MKVSKTASISALSFDRAVVCFPDGEIVEGKLDRWAILEDGNLIWVRISGTNYLTNSENVVLLNTRNDEES